MSKPRKVLLLTLMALILIVLNADTNVMAPNLAAIESHFGGLTDADLGLMMGIFTVVGAVISILFGYAADKIDRKLLFVLSVGLGEIPCLMTAFAPTYGWFFALRIICGLGVGAAFPLVFSIIGDIFDEKERPVATAILTTAYAVGNIAGTLLGGFLSSPALWSGIWPGTLIAANWGDSVGWRFPFILAAAPNFPLLLLFAFLVPAPKAAASEAATRELVEAGILYPRKISASDYLSLAKIKTNVGLFVQGLMGTVPWGAMFFLNVFLEQDKGLSKMDATLVFLVFGVGMIVGTVAGGIWGGALFKRNPKFMPIFCSLTTLLGCGLTVMVLLVAAPMALLSLIGFSAAFFVAMTGPNMRTMLLDVNTPEQRGPIFSIFNLTDSVGQGAGKWVAGVLTLLFASRATSLTICVLFWLGCAVTLWIVARFFPRDIGGLHETMEGIAKEMKGGRT